MYTFIIKRKTKIELIILAEHKLKHIQNSNNESCDRSDEYPKHTVVHSKSYPSSACCDVTKIRESRVVKDF